MKISYDKTANAAYIELCEDLPIHSTKEISSHVFIDLDKFDMTVGVEILNPSIPVKFCDIEKEVHIREAHAEDLKRALISLSEILIQQNQSTKGSPVLGKNTNRPLEFS